MTSVPQLELTTERRFRFSPWLRGQLELLPPQVIELAEGPPELAVMDIVPDLAYCREAWPHTDPNWADSVFFTMTIDGDMYQFSTLSNPDGVRVPAGKVFRVDPLELHWLRPDPVVSTTWLALQWVVPRDKTTPFEQALSAAVAKWNHPGFELPRLGEISKTDT